jgi:hypothetical protein
LRVTHREKQCYCFGSDQYSVLVAGSQSRALHTFLPPKPSLRLLCFLAAIISHPIISLAAKRHKNRKEDAMLPVLGQQLQTPRQDQDCLSDLVTRCEIEFLHTIPSKGKSSNFTQRGAAARHGQLLLRAFMVLIPPIFYNAGSGCSSNCRDSAWARPHPRVAEQCAGPAPCPARPPTGRMSQHSR